MNIRLQMLCVWTGPAMIVGWLASFWPLGGFIPPPNPELTPNEVVARYLAHTTEIRLALVLSMLASALLVPYSAVISSHLRRVEGPRSPWTTTQVVSAGLLSGEFIFPIMFWQVAAYRPSYEHADLTRMFNDFGWLTFVGITSTAAVQFASIGVVILFGEGPKVFPRWLGYVNIWVALAVLPGACVPLFKAGPLAWNGVIGFWLVLVAFTVWMGVMTPMLRRVIVKERDDLASGHVPADGQPVRAVEDERGGVPLDLAGQGEPG